MDQSRLGRSLDEVPHALERIADAGVRVWCVLTSQEVKRDTVVDRFQSNVMAFGDEMHREQARERIRAAMRRKAERGQVAGGGVYGYWNVRLDGHVEREIVPPEAETIRRLFTEVADGAGYVKVAKWLDAESVPSPTREGWVGSGI